jgi:Niemann-Pick C1 protein
LLSELNIPSRKRKRSLSKMKIDNDLDFETRFYCAIMNGLEHVCKRDIFIEMWNSNRTAIKRLTESEILDKVNEFPYDPETGHFINYRWMLGGVEKDESGRIISAKSVITAWNLKVNFINENKIDKVQWQSEDQLDIESIMDGIIEHYKEKYDDNDTLLSYGLGRSYGDTSSKSMFEDISKVVLGVTITIIYVIFVTSKYGWVELRCSLAIVGIINVGLAYFR